MPPWSVDWWPAARVGLRKMHPWNAARLARDVQRFAESEEGDVDVEAGDPHVLRLRASRAVARLRVEPDTRTICVMTVFPV